MELNKDTNPQDKISKFAIMCELNYQRIKEEAETVWRFPSKRRFPSKKNTITTT